MPKLTLHPASPADIPRISFIQAMAFLPNSLNQAMFPLGVTNSQLECSNARHTKVLSDMANADGPKIFFMAVKLKSEENADGEVVAFGKWSLEGGHKSDTTDSTTTWPEGANTSLLEEFFGKMKEKHHEIWGDRPHYYLELLCTHPDYQNTGAGSLLLRTMLSQVDKDNLPCYLESSPYARPIYEKYGFNVVDKIRSGGGEFITPCMVRDPRTGRHEE